MTKLNDERTGGGKNGRRLLELMQRLNDVLPLPEQYEWATVHWKHGDKKVYQLAIKDRTTTAVTNSYTTVSAIGRGAYVRMLHTFVMGAEERREHEEDPGRYVWWGRHPGTTPGGTRR